MERERKRMKKREEEKEKERVWRSEKVMTILNFNYQPNRTTLTIWEEYIYYIYYSVAVYTVIDFYFIETNSYSS